MTRGLSECTCEQVQDRYQDGEWARSYTLTVNPSCGTHGGMSKLSWPA